MPQEYLVPVGNMSNRVQAEVGATKSFVKYPKRFGIMNCSLNAHSSPGYLPSKFVQGWSATNPCGLQFPTSTGGFRGHTMGGSSAQALDAGVKLGPHWVEIYPLDGDNAANAKLLTDIAARIAGRGGAVKKGADR